MVRLDPALVPDSSLPPHPDLVPAAPTPSCEEKLVSEPQSDASNKPVLPENNESEDLPLKTLKKTVGSPLKKPPKEKSEAKKDTAKVKRTAESDSPSPVKKAKKSKVVSDQEARVSQSGDDKKSVTTSDKVTAEEVTKGSDAFANSFNNVQPINGSPVINSQQSTTGIAKNTFFCLLFKNLSICSWRLQAIKY